MTANQVMVLALAVMFGLLGLWACALMLRDILECLKRIEAALLAQSERPE